MTLSGNTVLVSGGGSGIGRGLAEAFHQRGNQVIIGGRRRDVLEQTAAANPGMGYVVLDTTSPESIASAAQEVTAKHPALNVVINNAGVQRMHNFADGEVKRGAIDEEVHTNIYGVIDMTTAFLPHLQTKPAATIINVSSGLAFLPMARFPVYCATKAFVHSFTMSLRHQLRKTSVRVVELAPPWVATDLDALHRSELEGMANMSPMPLGEFIQAAMQELAGDGEELAVGRAKFLYGAGVGPQAATVFEQINAH